MKMFAKNLDFCAVLIFSSQMLHAQQPVELKYPAAFATLYSRRQFDDLTGNIGYRLAAVDSETRTSLLMRLADYGVQALQGIQMISAARNIDDAQKIAHQQLQANAVRFRDLVRMIGFPSDAVDLVKIPTALRIQKRAEPQLPLGITKLAETMPQQYAFSTLKEGKYKLLPP